MNIGNFMNEISLTAFVSAVNGVMSWVISGHP